MLSTTNDEYYQLLHGNYILNENQVVQTGMPRHDLLKKKAYEYRGCDNILIQFHWRTFAKTEEKMKSSKFIKCVNAFLNDKRLVDVCDKYGIKLLLKLHPNLYKFKHLIQCPDNIIFVDRDVEDISFQDIFAMSKVIITDFSSNSYEMGFGYNLDAFKTYLVLTIIDAIKK